jgi:hypothetical protein
MSFDAEIRASLDPSTLLKTLHRTVWRSEAVREVKDSLEGHVHKIGFAADLGDNYTENFNDGNVTRGTYVPYEPNATDSYVYQNFNCPYGTGQKNDLTVNSVAYDRLPIPDQGFLGSNFNFQFYCLDGSDSWLWVRDCPPVQKLGWSAGLNQNGSHGQFLAFDSFGTVFDWTAQNFSEQFWFKLDPSIPSTFAFHSAVKHLYPTRLPVSNPNKILKMYTIDASNFYTIELDLTDFKILIDFCKAGVYTKRESAGSVNLTGWNHLAYTWAFTTPTLSPRLNDVAFVTSTKTGLGAVTGAATRPSYGGYGGAPSTRDFNGQIGYMIYYKHSTVLTTAEMTNLYNWGTKYAVSGKRPYIIPYALLAQT